MIKVKDIIGDLEKKYPKVNAESWDNVGLIVGKLNQEVKKKFNFLLMLPIEL